MNQLTLDKLQYGIQQYISENLIRDARIDIEGLSGFIGDSIVARCRMELFGKDTGVFTYREPKTWWDHLKQDNKFIRKLFGDPEYKFTKLMLRVTLDPESKQFASERDRMRIVEMESVVAWDKMYEEANEYVRYNDMVFYPTIYKLTE